MFPTRLTDVSVCKEVTKDYPDYFTFNEEEWFGNPNNFAYVKNKNVGFAELKSPGNYWVHFCFHDARGREAINLTKEMIKALYEDTSFVSLVGLIWKGNRPARWLIRQAGFKSEGFVETENGTCEMFIFTKKDLLT